MKVENEDRAGVFLRAWNIIEKDSTIPREEKEGILKLIEAMMEAIDSTSGTRRKDDPVMTFTQEIISKHSLMTLVKRQADELDALKRLGLNLTSSLDLQTVLDAVVTEAMHLVKHARAAHIYLYHNDVLEFGASLNAEGVRNKPLSNPRPTGLTYSVATKGETMIIGDISSHPLYTGTPRSWHGSIIAIPLKFSTSTVGVMNLSRSITGNFTRAEIRLLGLLADQAAVAISNASLHKQVMEQANTDLVTGLANRRALDERLQEEIRFAKQAGSHFSVVMMDLDGFKAVNDTHGHGVGDEILHDAFNYLARNMRSTDFLARYGGDELTLIMRESGIEAAKIVTQKIINLISEFSFKIPDSDETIRLGLTAGIATYPIHSKTAGDLLRAADSALYDAKKHRRGRYIVAPNPTGPLDSTGSSQDPMID
ncbi:MAG: sensor domain-containing diguanylate cyclase [Chloroflexi bacterium]|nr:sensor domain-containing diguanylate cyclase [Chloroflexota bacterium]